MNDERVVSIERDIAGILANQKNFDDLLDKLDSTLSKITDVSHSITQMLAVHQNRIDRHDKTIEKNEADLRSIHVRIHEVKNELRAEIQSEHADIMSKLQQYIETNNAQHKIISDRFTKIEKFIWTVCGGGIVIGFILGELIPKLLNIL